MAYPGLSSDCLLTQLYLVAIIAAFDMYCDTKSLTITTRTKIIVP